MSKKNKYAGFSIVFWEAALVSAFVLISCQKNETQTEPLAGKIVPLSKHWEQAVPLQTVPKGLTSLSSRECGKCHDDIYAEWKTSFHAQAWQDPQFQSEWAKDDSLWVCINCHIPLQNQQRYVITGKIEGDYFRPAKKKNPDFDAKLREESITCAACHVRDGYVIGPYGNQPDAPHAVKQDTVHLSRQLCFGCHNVTEVLDPSLVCVFGTGDEWQRGPYPKAGRDCISCHMPEVIRPVSSAGLPRKTRKHIWIGSGIPKSSSGDVEEVAPVAGYIRGIDVRIKSNKATYHPGEVAYFTVTLINQRAGHLLPTGDPEYFYTLHMQALTSPDKVIKQRTERIGQEWQWWPEAKKLNDNRLKPLESRSYSFNCKIPFGSGKVAFNVRLVSHRMTKENASYNKLLKNYPFSALIFEKRIWLTPALPN